MVHVGFEPSAVLGAHRKLGDNWKLLSWQLSGQMGGSSRPGNGHGNGNANGHGNGHSSGRQASGLNAGHPPPSDVLGPDGRLRVL